MADEHHRAAEVAQGVEQDPLAVQVEVVGRLVHDQQVARLEEHPRQLEPRPLPAREDPDRLVHVVAAEQEAAEDRAVRDRGLGRRGLLHRLQERVLAVGEVVLVLREVLDLDLVPELDPTLAGVEALAQQLEQRRLAGAVDADHGQLLAGRQLEVEPAEHLVLAIGLAQPVQAEGELPAALGLGEAQLERGRLVGELDPLDLGQLLDPALDVARRGGLGAVAVDELLLALQLALLAGVLLLEVLDPLGALDLEARVVARVDRQLAHLQLEHLGDEVIEEVAVVAGDDQRALVAAEEGQQPLARLEVEVVGRLVEEQRVGAREQELGQVDAHPPAAREGAQLAVHALLAEAQPVQDRARLGVDPVAVHGLEARLGLAVALEQAGVLGVEADLGRELLDLALELGQVADRGQDLLDHGPRGGLLGHVLGQVADRAPLADVDRPLLDRGQPHDHLHEGRLALPVAPGHAHALAGADPKGHVVEERAVAQVQA